MSLCPDCAHNSVHHIRTGTADVYRGCILCDCDLGRFDPEWRKHTDERGNPLPGHAAYVAPDDPDES